MSVIEATGVTAGYGRRIALRDCGLALDAGEVVAVVGPNGAGKSTLVRVLAGLLRPRSGDVRIGDRALRDLSRPEIARQVAVVPQSFETLFPFSVREIVALGRTARLDALGRAGPSDAVAVDRALGALELRGLADRNVAEISGGERQRAVLAMALAQETPALLLDEPTVHLDPAHQLAIIALLRRLARERGLAILAVMHDLNLAALCDRVIVLADGGIVRDGPPPVTIEQRLVSAIFGEAWRVTVHDGRPAVLPESRG